MQTSSDAIKDLIRKSPLSLLEISRRARVSYGPLQRWFSGTTAGYNLLSADAVYYVLTGETLVKVPSAREEAA